MIPHLKLCECNVYAPSHSDKNILSRTYTPIYIQEQGCTFVHTMNSLVVQQNHQNIQMRSQNLMLSQILATVSINAPLHIIYVPDIASLTNISTTSSADITHPPTYKHLHRHFLPEKEGNIKLFLY